VSDAYRVHVCERTGLIAVANLRKQSFHSQVYKSDSSIVQVRVQEWVSVRNHGSAGFFGALVTSTLNTNAQSPSQQPPPILQVYLPYAAKLLLQELMAMCIAPRLQFGAD